LKDTEFEYSLKFKSSGERVVIDWDARAAGSRAAPWWRLPISSGPGLIQSERQVRAPPLS
jgi:hypothetical protein